MTASRRILTALALVVLLSAAGNGDGDWALLIPGEAPICAKSELDCYAARDAIGEGRWRPVGTVGWDLVRMDCKPHPGCFSPLSNCIQGFNCERHR